MRRSSCLQSDYLSRINRVIDYIEANLEKVMTLSELASVSHFSKFHFTRVFRSVVGETPYQFILRLRIEKAAMLLRSNPMLQLTELSYQCGFSDISVFSRNFRSYFNESATDYRRRCFDESNNGQLFRNDHQSHQRVTPYFCTDLQTLKWKSVMVQNKGVEVRQVPPITVAYVRHIGPYEANDRLYEQLWNKLFSWAGAHGLVQSGNFQSMVVYHDDPYVTEEEKLRMSVCITVPESTSVGGEVGKMQLASSLCVVARFELLSTEFKEAWDWLFGVWFPASGYQPDDKPCFEVYPEEPKDGRYIVDICVPLKPL